MTTMMTITDPDWTRDEIIKGWLDEETAAVAEVAADTEIAWLINHTHKAMHLEGWTFDAATGSFTGPASNWSNLVDTVMSLIVEATDYAIENLDEIREMAAETAA